LQSDSLLLPSNQQIYFSLLQESKLQMGTKIIALTPGFRKFMLTTHVTFSVGWLGAVAGFLALNIAALTSQNAQMVRSAYLSMDIMGWYVILPSCLCALLTGVLQSLGTPWGLFKHYWVLVKFLLTAGSTFLLLLHMQQIRQAAMIASETPVPDTELRSLGINLVTKAVAALLVLVATTTISVYKPWGKIKSKPCDNNLQINMKTKNATSRKKWGFYTLIGIVIAIVIIIIKHLAGGGMKAHHS
jgi:hypothetical protein